MEKNTHKISIIMATYNCESTIDEAIDSIINQTYTNWELIICDDCSIDNTYEKLYFYKEKYPGKIILLKNKVNSRLSYSLNRCLEVAKGKYVARMDGDDISLPDRFEKQVFFLQNNPSIHVVGTLMRRFSSGGLADIMHNNEKPDKYTLRYNVPFFHATIMTYKHVYDTLGGYTVSERTVRGQDVDLWFRFFHEGFKGMNIMEPLYLVREDLAAIKRRTFRVRWNAYKTTMIGYRLLNYPLLWYIKPTFEALAKSIIPDRLIYLYRNIQKKRFYKNENAKKA
ncbi:glycosyltransferase family 2 protein [Bacillus sp. m3-13]|uniref:glycosyltransferase family 2 protein n=1 Tax=Bacillus sp. m3-13 TaxID=406124 RepID=UPI0001E89E0E|nr:glycosyltransferase family 2 protein [Bacillus sp. m3-13]